MPEWTVSALNARIRGLIEDPTELQNIVVTGEISNPQVKSSGHCYFDLKDTRSRIHGMMFQSDVARLAAPLKDGQAVTMTGRVGVYEPQAQTQFYARTATLIGEGAARAALEALYRRLKAEGVLGHPKRRLPLLPRGIAVVTSTTGAVRHDIDQVTDRRFPGMPRYVIGATVQGATAPQSLVAALHQAASYPVSVIILARGGGSKDDLIAFNDEQVVRAVAQSPLPIISAIGHGVDRSLTDLAADYAAATPSQAAEMAVPVLQDLLRHHRDLRSRSQQALDRRLVQHRLRWTALTTRPVLVHPEQLTVPYRQALDRLDERRDRAWDTRWTTWGHTHDLLHQRLRAQEPSAQLAAARQQITRLHDRLERSWHDHWSAWTHQVALLSQRTHAFDPLAILQQGYAYASTDPSPDARIVTARTLQLNQPFVVRWHDGTAEVTAHTIYRNRE